MKKTKVKYTMCLAVECGITSHPEHEPGRKSNKKSEDKGSTATKVDNAVTPKKQSDLSRSVARINCQNKSPNQEHPTAKVLNLRFSEPDQYKSGYQKRIRR